MAQFTPFSPNVEVNGQTARSIIDAIPVGRDYRMAILERHGIKNPQPNQWYPQEKWLDAFKEIHDTIGQNTLFNIGKAIPENAQFPPQIDNLEKALQAIDMAYKMNHRGGEIGYYKVLSFDKKNKTAVMECKNPYPSEFDRGIIMAMLRKFKPIESVRYDVTLDTSKPTRINGADSCTYLISW